ncbi:MAG: hypothetical protein U0172_15005 [Nitrospiraceae bacterium]
MRNKQKAFAIVLIGLLLIVGWSGFRLWQYRELEHLRQGFSALKTGDFSRAIATLRPLAESGVSEAQQVLGMAYANGWGVEKDDTQAAIWFRRAECHCKTPGKSEYDTAMEFLYRDKKDPVSGAYWVRRAAEAGYPAAQSLLADQIQLAKHGLEVDPVVRQYWEHVLGKTN